MAKKANQEMERIFEEWQELENDTINLTERVFNNTENSFVKAMMSIIRHDSEKRKSMLRLALAHMTTGAAGGEHQKFIQCRGKIDTDFATSIRSA